MSIGPMTGIAGSTAGTSLAQAKGSDLERTQQDVGAQQLVAQTEQKAESAAGVGEPDVEEHETAERDADGRLPWKIPAAKRQGERPGDQPPQPPADPTGESGNLLDLSG